MISIPTSCPRPAAHLERAAMCEVGSGTTRVDAEGIAPPQWWEL